MRFAQRIQPLQRNVFADMDRAKAQALAADRPLIDLSLGSADLPAPPHVLDTIAQSLRDPKTHGYLLHHGTRSFRQTAAEWYMRRFGQVEDLPDLTGTLTIDPDTEVLLLIGSQEGTAHLPLALMDPGDFALLQDPSYPSHAGGVHLAGGQIHWMPLLAEHGFLPQFETIPPQVLEQSRLMVLSYPHNPTTAIAPLVFFEQAVAFCRHHDLILIHDFPYPDLGFDGVAIPSVFHADPDKTVSIELFSLSKSYNMGGFRVAYAIGNAEVIQALRQVKAVIDFNQYLGILHGAIAALTGPQDCVQTMNACFKHRRDSFVNALHKIGWSVPIPPATMYLWARLPEPWQNNSMEFGVRLVEATGVAVAPGVGFGKSGEGYVRFALVHESEILEEAAHKIHQFLNRS